MFGLIENLRHKEFIPSWQERCKVCVDWCSEYEWDDVIDLGMGKLNSFQSFIDPWDLYWTDSVIDPDSNIAKTIDYAPKSDFV